MKPRVLIFLCLGILLTGALLRLVNPNALPIFADEAIYVRWSQVMRAEPSLRFLPQSDGKQPLFMWVLMPALKLFADPLVAGRTISALAGLGTTVGVGLAAYLLFKNLRLAVIAAGFWSVLPYAVFFDRLALVDSFLAFFYVWYFVFMTLALSRLRLDFALLAGFAGGFAWLTKSPAIFALGLTPALFLFLPRFTRRNFFIACGLWLVAGSIAFGMYNILRLGPQFHMIAIRNRDYVYTIQEALRGPLDPLVPHLKDTLGFFLYLATPLGLLFAVWGIFEGQRHHLPQRVVLAGFALVPIFVQAFMAKGFTARYLLFTAPFAVILAAHAVEHLGQRTNKHALTLAAAGLLVLLSLGLDIQLITHPEEAPLPKIERSGYLEEWTAGTGLREVSNIIRSAAAAGPVVVGSEGFFGTPFDALALYLNDLPNVRVVGVGVWIDSVNEKLSSALVDNQVFLVVNSTRFHADPQGTPGLKLLSSYPKAVRLDGTREDLLFFKVIPQ